MPAENSPAEWRSPLIVLIVDDSPEDREMAKSFLSEAAVAEGLRIMCSEASDGKAGLASYRAQQPDCIILDYYLPDMSGLDFLQNLKSQSDDVAVPVVMLTGAADISLSSFALSAGVQEYLPKQYLGSEMLLRAVKSSRDRFNLRREQRRTDAALRAREAMLRLSQEAGGIASFKLDYLSGLCQWAAGSQVLLGFAPVQSSTTTRELLALIHPDDINRLLDQRDKAQADRQEKIIYECRICRPDTGAVRRVEIRLSIQYDTTGTPLYSYGAVMDVTEQRAASDALARMNDELERRVNDRTAALLEESRRRQEAEGLLHQAQKMEALGQLTGGIAHDFNNLLQAVIGNLDIAHNRITRLMTEDARDQAPALASLLSWTDAAFKAAMGGSKLVKRMLVFARRGQLDAVELDANRVISGLSEMISLSIGPMIAFETRLQDDLWPTYIDPTQLETAILNLAVNARDAMPSGGSLTIQTANFSLDENSVTGFADIVPGDYVLLSVSDTGTGIPPELINHIFEPFFTTKPVGAGTGLGLAMVYGLCKQSLGGVHIESTVGNGTLVTMYLPRCPLTILAAPPSKQHRRLEHTESGSLAVA